MCFHLLPTLSPEQPASTDSPSFVLAGSRCLDWMIHSDRISMAKSSISIRKGIRTIKIDLEAPPLVGADKFTAASTEGILQAEELVDEEQFGGGQHNSATFLEHSFEAHVSAIDLPVVPINLCILLPDRRVIVKSPLPRESLSKKQLANLAHCMQELRFNTVLLNSVKDPALAVLMIKEGRRRGARVYSCPNPSMSLPQRFWQATNGCDLLCLNLTEFADLIEASGIPIERNELKAEPAEIATALVSFCSTIANSPDIVITLGANGFASWNSQSRIFAHGKLQGPTLARVQRQRESCRKTINGSGDRFFAALAWHHSMSRRAHHVSPLVSSAVRATVDCANSFGRNLKITSEDIRLVFIDANEPECLHKFSPCTMADKQTAIG